MTPRRTADRIHRRFSPSEIFERSHAAEVAVLSVMTCIRKPSDMNDKITCVQVSYLDIRQSNAVVITEVDHSIAATIRRLK
jgi:hypothetical protein